MDLRDPTVPKPYWRDCDGDGLGDGRAIFNEESGETEIRPRRCWTNSQLQNEQPDCEDIQVPEGVTPRFVVNARDCDDGYASSGGGSRNGANCPGNFGPVLGESPIAPVDYEVAQVGEKEFLIFHDREVDDGTAREICEAWRIGSIPENLEEPPVLPAEPLATLEDDFQLGQFVDRVQQTLDSGEQWVGWVGARSPVEFNDDMSAITGGVLDANWGWNVEEPPENFNVGFCDGVAPIPMDILLGVAWPFLTDLETIDPDEFLDTDFEQQLQNLRLVMLIEADAELPCLTYVSDPLVCPEGPPCFANAACERVRLDPFDVEVFDLDAENTCANTEEE